MSLKIGETKVNVCELNKDGEICDDLFTGVFMGFGTIGLGINGIKQGVMVLSDVDDETSQVSIHDLRACFFVKE